jgi:hypothetical protein
MRDPSPVSSVVFFFLLLVLAVIGATRLSQCHAGGSAPPTGYGAAQAPSPLYHEGREEHEGAQSQLRAAFAASAQTMESLNNASGIRRPNSISPQPPSVGYVNFVVVTFQSTELDLTQVIATNSRMIRLSFLYECL